MRKLGLLYSIFLPNVAVRIHTDSELWKTLQEMVAFALEKNRIEVTATMRNNVYIQDFGPGSTPSSWFVQCRACMLAEFRCLQPNTLFAILAPASLLGFVWMKMVGMEYSLNEVTEEAISHFFSTRKKDAYQLAADLTTAPFREPQDYGGCP